MRTTFRIFAALALVGAAVPAVARSPSGGWGTPAQHDQQRSDDGGYGAAPYADRWGASRNVNFDDHGAPGHNRHDRHDERRDDDRRYNDRHDNRRDADRRDWQRGQAYGYGRPDPRYNGYYADNYYRSGGYQTRRLGTNDRIYRGQDNRYYCRRSDGTTGLIIGALGGGVLGNVIAPGGSKTLGSILGGGLGAVLGSSIDKGNVTCR